MTSFGSDLILARLHRLHPKAIDLSLGRMERVLAALGHPEGRLPPVVHIAGTNGKGSVLAMLDAMLRASGRRVQRYVSPHLVHFNERILLDGRPIEDALLADLLDRCEAANAGEPITFFEITTAAAFLAFAERPADVLLLEVGLGGRLDATNVVHRPQITVLTPISLDHETHLGDTVALIAAEKAGILKPGVPAVVGPQGAEALGPIRARAEALAVPLTLHGQDFDAWREGGRLVVDHRGRRLELPPPALAGRHQIDNAGVAVAAALALGSLTPSPAAIAVGLQSARWPARLQHLRRGSLVDLLPKGVELWLDGGHNPAAGEVLAQSLAGDPLPLHLVVGMLTTKDARGFLAPLAEVAASVHAVPVPNEPLGQDPAAIATHARALGLAAETATSVRTAVAAILAHAPRKARILICGSLYLAGHVLRDHG